VIGWVNASRQGGELTIEAGFVSEKRPSGKSFQRAFEEEAQRLQRFFHPPVRTTEPRPMIRTTMEPAAGS
jgi:hypothetical protein